MAQLLVDLWHVSHAAVVATCVAFLPVAVVPLWQLAQVPVTPVWLKVTVVQLEVDVWQVSQELDVAMCLTPLPVALLPLWQLEQFPVTPA